MRESVQLLAFFGVWPNINLLDRLILYTLNVDEVCAARRRRRLLIFLLLESLHHNTVATSSCTYILVRWDITTKVIVFKFEHHVGWLLLKLIDLSQGLLRILSVVGVLKVVVIATLSLIARVMLWSRYAHWVHLRDLRLLDQLNFPVLCNLKNC